MAAVFTFVFPIVFLVVVGTSAGGVAGARDHPALRPVRGGGHADLRADRRLLHQPGHGHLHSAARPGCSSGCGAPRSPSAPTWAASSASVLINVAILTVIVVGIGMAFYHLHFPYHPAAVVVDPAGRAS